MRMGKTMPMRPLVRTFRAQQEAKAQQRIGFGVGVDCIDPTLRDETAKDGAPERWWRVS